MNNINNSLIIVGIGASAGGLEALQKFLLNLPAERGNIAYVVVQHLSPKHKSMMVELLARETPFEVLEIVNGMSPKANTVYITPPDRDVYLEKKLFKLKKPAQHWVGPKPSVDKFFISLAQEMQDRSVGVILSGTGTDGSQGIRAIRAEGGIAIAQKPDEAKYDGMPLAAIQTKSIDYILSVSDIAQEVIHLLRYPKSLRVAKAENDELYNVFEILKDYIGTDFSLYKKSTITRRIERRMAAIKSIDLSEYIEYLRSNSGEVELLYKDMLIGVTSFFRDGEPFDDLAKEIQSYIDENPNIDTFRVWAPACASGEEAYSLAITLDELLLNHKSVHVKIFATDIDEDSVMKARKGVYPEVSISNISEERRQRYFIQRGNEFEVKAILKERVIFSRHDITIDPPFMNLNLIVCRNMLIYFEGELQKRIFTTFAYALNPNALLFLGKSETVGSNTELFATISQKSKLYSTRTTTESRKALYPQLANPSKYLKPSAAIKKRHSGNMEDAIKNTLFDYYDSKCIVVDNNFNIHYIKGNVNDLLSFPTGEINNNILKMLPDTLSLEIRSLIYKINKGEQTFTFPIETQRLDADKMIHLKITPLEGYAGNYQYFLLCFELKELVHVEEIAQNTERDINEDIKRPEQELMATREHLQTVVEELETSNEELQSSNEELQASNEELQASNEELETTNEELQSTNEELQTAYAEIRALYEKQNIQNTSLEERTQELIHLKGELDIQYNFLKGVLDTEKNIVVVTDGHNITSVNQSFLNFFNQFEDLDAFKEEYKCICEHFEIIDEEDYIYDKKGGINWLQLILHSNRSDLKVKMKKNTKVYTYHIMANELNGSGNIYVVTLTDITDIQIAKDNMSKALSDEIRSNISSSKMLYNAHTVLGIDMFVRQLFYHIKSPLNRMNQFYHQLSESMISSENKHNEYEFKSEKDNILDGLNFLKDFFTQEKGQKINVYSNIEQFSLVLKSKNIPLSIEVIGNHDIEFHDTKGQFSTLTLLWLSMFINIISESKETLKIEIKKELDTISIIVRTTKSNQLFSRLLACQNDNIAIEDKNEKIYDSFKTLVSFLDDVYYGKFYVYSDHCQINIG